MDSLEKERYLHVHPMVGMINFPIPTTIFFKSVNAAEQMMSGYYFYSRSRKAIQEKKLENSEQIKWMDHFRRLCLKINKNNQELLCIQRCYVYNENENHPCVRSYVRMLSHMQFSKLFQDLIFQEENRIQQTPNNPTRPLTSYGKKEWFSLQAYILPSNNLIYLATFNCGVIGNPVLTLEVCDYETYFLAQNTLSIISDSEVDCRKYNCTNKAIRKKVIEKINEIKAHFQMMKFPKIKTIRVEFIIDRSKQFFMLDINAISFFGECPAPKVSSSNSVKIPESPVYETSKYFQKITRRIHKPLSKEENEKVNGKEYQIDQEHVYKSVPAVQIPTQLKNRLNTTEDANKTKKSKLLSRPKSPGFRKKKRKKRKKSIVKYRKESIQTNEPLVATKNLVNAIKTDIANQYKMNGIDPIGEKKRVLPSRKRSIHDIRPQSAKPARRKSAKKPFSAMSNISSKNGIPRLSIPAQGMTPSKVSKFEKEYSDTQKNKINHIVDQKEKFRLMCTAYLQDPKPSPPKRRSSRSQSLSKRRNPAQDRVKYIQSILDQVNKDSKWDVPTSRSLDDDIVMDYYSEGSETDMFP